MTGKISDEEWDEFIRQAEQGGSEAPKEPSARARMVTERLRQEEAERAKAAKRRFGRKAAAAAGDPPGWRTGPASQDMRGGKRAGRLKPALAILLIAGLALIALRPELLIDRLTGASEQRDAGPLAAETARPTGAPPEVPADRPTLREPFRGSPAAQWADGAAGIELPEAKAVGGFGKEQVADTLARARQFLIDSNLDPATLRGGRPEAALKVLDPRQPELLSGLERKLAKPSVSDNPTGMFSRFDPAAVKPVGNVVKVRGRMEARAGRAGELLAVTDYSFVYPVTKAAPGSEEVARVIVRRQITLALLDPDRWETTRGRLQVRQYLSESSNVECDSADGYLHPAFRRDEGAGPAPSGPAADPYDRSREIGGDGGCGVSSRS
ncbi:hypothetical protein [Streptomyces sp. NPDC048603]|uniref:hypothetical protein n=1 Tax=Streptomyces sp. NPDC048603 TaxID=3365577 RepID=UPI00371FF5AD